MSKSLSIFETKQKLTYDLIAMLNSSVTDSSKYLKIVNRLCHKYTCEQLVAFWQRTAFHRF